MRHSPNSGVQVILVEETQTPGDGRGRTWDPRPELRTHYTPFAAPAQVADVIDGVWRAQFFGDSRRRLRLVPDARAEIVAFRGLRWSAEGGGATAGDRLILIGALSKPMVIGCDGPGECVGVRLRTVAAGAILRGSVAAHVDRIRDLGDVAPRLRLRIADALRGSGAISETVTALALAFDASRVRAVDHVVGEFIASCSRERLPRCRDEAAEGGMSVRTLQRRVGSTTGLRPSLLRRVIRFRNALLALLQAPTSSHSSLALRFGYYDHAHLIRDFGEFCGESPLAFLRRACRRILSVPPALPITRDAAEAVAFVQAVGRPSWRSSLPLAVQHHHPLSSRP